MKVIYQQNGKWVSISAAIGFHLEDLAEEQVPDGAEWEIVGDDDPRLIPDLVAAPPHLNHGGLVRFTGVAPSTVLEAIRMVSVTRVAKGRYRAAHENPMPSDQYSATPAIFDANPRIARITARTETYVEIRVTDLAGAAQDPAEIMLKTERVVYS